MTTNSDNTKVTFQGNKLTLIGAGLKVGSKMPAFTLTAQDMSDLSSSKYAGKVLVISVVPSLDTPTCALQTKRFNKEAEKLGSNVHILTVSLDLPFAQKRWCGAEGTSRVETGSDYKHHSFGQAFGCFIKEWALLGRAVFVVDKSGTITFVEYVPSISDEPSYSEVLKSVSAAVEG
jgi:thiol peroxidase